MKYYVEQRLFSFFDKFDIYDENGDVAYYVEGSFLSFGKQFRIYDKHNNQVGYIEQKILTFLPQFEIYVDNIHIGTLVKELTFFNQNYYLKDSDLSIQGDILAHDYKIMEGDMIVASISKQWFTFGDKYFIDIIDGFDDIIAISIMLSIDAVIATSSNTTTTN